MTSIMSAATINTLRNEKSSSSCYCCCSNMNNYSSIFRSLPASEEFTYDDGYEENERDLNLCSYSTQDLFDLSSDHEELEFDITNNNGNGNNGFTENHRDIRVISTSSNGSAFEYKNYERRFNLSPIRVLLVNALSDLSNLVESEAFMTENFRASTEVVRYIDSSQRKRSENILSSLENPRLQSNPPLHQSSSNTTNLLRIVSTSSTDKNINYNSIYLSMHASRHQHSYDLSCCSASRKEIFESNDVSILRKATPLIEMGNIDHFEETFPHITLPGKNEIDCDNNGDVKNRSHPNRQILFFDEAIVESQDGFIIPHANRVSQEHGKSNCNKSITKIGLGEHNKIPHRPSILDSFFDLVTVALLSYGMIALCSLIERKNHFVNEDTS